MIYINSITKIYKNSKAHQAYGLKDVTIDMPDKGIVVVYGESGSGKTTLLNCIAGYDSFDEGTINYDNVNRISAVFQDFQLIDHLTVKENLDLVCSISHSCDDTKIIEVLKKLNLIEEINHLPNQLSGGQKQRVAIARSILLDSDVILADEPTGNVDDDNKKVILDLFINLSKQKLVVIVTHDPLFFKNSSDLLIHLSKGKVISMDGNIQKNNKDALQQKKDVSTYKLPLFVAAKMVFKGFSQLRKKYVTTAILTLLTMIMWLFLLNIYLQDESNSAYHVFKESNYQSIDLINDKAVDENSYLKYQDITEEQIKYLENLNYQVVNFYKNDSAINLEISNASNVYMEEEVYKITIDQNKPSTLLWESSNDYENEIYISEYIANNIFDELNMSSNDEFSQYVFSLRDIEVNIKGIYRTVEGFDENNMDKTYHSAIFTNLETYEQISISSDKVSVDIMGENEINTYVVSSNIDSQDLLFGSDVLLSNQIIISELIAEEVLGQTSDLNQLIGQNIVLKMMNRGTLIEEQTYVIAGISKNKGIARPSIYISDSDKDMFEFKYSIYSLENKGYHGITVNTYDKDLLYALDHMDMSHDMPESAFINQISGFLESIKNVILMIAIIMMSITMLVYMSFIDNSIYQKQREIGVLRSIGVKSNETIKMFLIENFLIVLPSLIISIVVDIGLIRLFNKYVIMQNLTLSNVIYLVPKSIVLLIIVMITMSLVYMLISAYKIYRRTTIELIYYKN